MITKGSFPGAMVGGKRVEKDLMTPVKKESKPKGMPGYKKKRC